MNKQQQQPKPTVKHYRQKLHADKEHGKTTSANITLCCVRWKIAPSKIRTRKRGSQLSSSITQVVLAIRHEKEQTHLGFRREK